MLAPSSFSLISLFPYASPQVPPWFPLLYSSTPLTSSIYIISHIYSVEEEGVATPRELSVMERTRPQWAGCWVGPF